MRMTKKGYTLAVLAAISLLTQGCCTLFNGRHQTVTIESSPSQAMFRVDVPYFVFWDTELKGTTPATVSLKRNGSYMVMVQKDGYKPKGVAIESQTTWFPLILDIVLWPTFFIDFATGSAYELTPSKLFIELEKE